MGKSGHLAFQGAAAFDTQHARGETLTQSRFLIFCRLGCISTTGITVDKVDGLFTKGHCFGLSQQKRLSHGFIDQTQAPSLLSIDIDAAGNNLDGFGRLH
ncbi:MAG: hypothetical protein BWY75_03496 [bacterium ADurb.Bin425]|nr:MAG: hypothetical protein BWY75_03496 [bacterium ADurb.Bin425]